MAIQFLTRFPITIDRKPTPVQLGRSVLAYPLVGLFIGSFLSVLAVAFKSVDPFAFSAVLLTLWTLMTGGLHLDGLADCADAWIGGGQSSQRSLTIMKDPHVGPLAVIILVLVLLLKFSAIAVLLRRQFELPLLLAPVVGRTAIILVMLTTPYIRPGGSGEVLVNRLPRIPGFCVSVAVLFLLAMFLGMTALFVCVCVFLVLRGLMLKRLGGATGDTYGAMVECMETAVLMVPVFLMG